MTEESPTLDANSLATAERLIGLAFTDAEHELMLEDMQKRLADYEALRAVPLDNSVPMALVFNPRIAGLPAPAPSPSPIPADDAAIPAPPANLEAAAFAPLTHLAHWLRTRQVTSLALTQMYLDRLKRYDETLHCVVTLTEDRALAQARQADADIAAGRYRGPLHGIPWGAKDLLAVRGYRTTWGAPPYQDQVVDTDAAVVERLDAAGAVLLAKLTVGSLAWGDIWFGGMTRNPWKTDEGSSGSSAGSASAVVAGLVGFAIGTETLGSIVSPSTRCGASGLRPTFGRVSRYGAMALCWSLDKIGPICRRVEDCALVFDAIRGADPRDLSAVDAPFTWNPAVNLAGLRVGYVQAAFDEERPNKANDDAVLQTLRDLGVNPIPITLPDLPQGMIRFILDAEAAAAFDDLTRSDRDDLLVRQGKEAWPNTFRKARLVPAVEYIQANRVRFLLMQQMARLMEGLDIYLCPSYGGNNLQMTNLTGHPAVVVPNGFTEQGTPTSITFTGRLDDEATVLAAAHAYQQATDWHTRHPAGFEV